MKGPLCWGDSGQSGIDGAEQQLNGLYFSSSTQSLAADILAAAANLLLMTVSENLSDSFPI